MSLLVVFESIYSVLDFFQDDDDDEMMTNNNSEVATVSLLVLQ